MDLSLPSIFTAFVAIFIVMDPFSSVPVFLSLTKKFTPKKRQEAAGVAGAVAALVLFGFLFIGPALLSTMGIRMESFEIGGGILMLLISISFALGIDFGKSEDTPLEAVIIGVPLLSGPGAMLTTILLANSVGLANVVVASALSCTASFLIILASSRVYRVIGKNGLEILSRVAGVLLAAFAVEFIRRGLGL
ncbi:MAG: MarC family protein [Candidatus Micrarchaeota archaeon]|nr:MarC family protein [Candidatus Micrarchaeota archaeon]